MQMGSDNAALPLAARAEVTRMRQAIEALPPGGTVTMSGEQFGKLSTLIEQLAVRKGCGDADCFHVPVDGFRWWVPLREAERDRSELTKLRTEYRRLCAELLRAQPAR